MSDEYLWDRSGPPDAEIERLERTLAALRYKHRGTLVREPPARAARSRPRWWSAAAAAAVVVAALGLSRLAPAPVRATGWQVASLHGPARLGSGDAAIQMPVRTGQLLRTGAKSELTLLADEVGKVDLGPDSELRAASNRQLLLQRGALHAYIWARPREFVVDTPSARAVDLGCEYTLNVDPVGNGVVRVSMGWVAFGYAGRESFIPAGAECLTRKRQGPGIPFYEDAPQPLQRALASFEQGDSAALGAILLKARPRDALTLWHLLTRVSRPDLGAVFDRFAELVPLPPDVTRAAVLRGDAHMIDLCWDALNLENTSWWRGWERRWQ
jgi:hypothetical protein